MLGHQEAGKLAESGWGVSSKKAVSLSQRWTVRSILVAEQQNLLIKCMWGDQEWLLGQAQASRWIVR